MSNEKQEASDILSKMFYRCERIDPYTKKPYLVAEVSHSIEPLVGLLRDPFAICPGLNTSSVPPSLHETANIQSKRFLLLSISAPFFINLPTPAVVTFNEVYNDISYDNENLPPWIYQRSKSTELHSTRDVKRPQIILLDIGSSYFGNWRNDTGSASGLWFYEYYKRFNVKFDRIIAYEFDLLDQKTAWKQLPRDVLPVYTLINTGVTERGKLNPWTMLQAVAHPNDHVIVKLDIDTAPLESNLVNQILNSSIISDLIDELFFEHHVALKEMMLHWGRPPGTLEDSYILFRKLRELGIRAHSWP